MLRRSSKNSSADQSNESLPHGDNQQSNESQHHEDSQQPDEKMKQLTTEEEREFNKLKKAIENWRTIFNLLGSFEATLHKLEHLDEEHEPDVFFDHSLRFQMLQYLANEPEDDDFIDDQWTAIFKNLSLKALVGVLIKSSEIKMEPVLSSHKIPLPDGSGGEAFRRDIDYEIRLDIIVPFIQVLGEFYLVRKDIDDDESEEEITKNSNPYGFKYIIKNTQLQLNLQITQIDEKFVLMHHRHEEMIRFVDDVDLNISYSMLTQDSDFQEEQNLRSFKKNNPEDPQNISSEEHEPIVLESTAYQKKILSVFLDQIKNAHPIVTNALQMKLITLITPRIRSMDSIYDLFDIFKSVIKNQSPTKDHQSKSFEDYFYDTVSAKSSVYQYIKNAMEHLGLNLYKTTSVERILAKFEKNDETQNGKEPAQYELKNTLGEDFERKLNKRIKELEDKINLYQISKKEKIEQKPPSTEPTKAEEEAEKNPNDSSDVVEM